MEKYLDRNSVLRLLQGIKTQIDKSKTNILDTKGVANGIASLDENGNVPLSQLGNVDTDINECLRRNNLRERVVPEEIIMKFYNRLTIPEKSEGFSNVIIWSERNKEKFEEKNVEKKELEYTI